MWKKMKRKSSLVAVAVAVILASVVSTASVYSVHFVDPTAPKTVIYNPDNSATVTIRIDSIQFWQNEVQSVMDYYHCTNSRAEEMVRDEIRSGRTVYFRDEAGRCWPFIYNRLTDEISVTFYGDQIPRTGSFCGAVVYTPIDTYDGAVWFIPVSGTRKPITPVPGTSIPEGIFAFSECVD